MRQYLDLLQRVLVNGRESKDRTGVGTIRTFGEMLRFDLRQGFPLVTTKKMFYNGVIHELIWMLSGSSSIEYLQKNNVHIWDAWADENGYVGPLYGAQWRDWLKVDESGNVQGIDQLKKAIEQIILNPYSRRIVVSAWNVAELPIMHLPPCHVMYQFQVEPKANELRCCVYMRSVDLFLGLPFDIASYALLTSMVAHVTGLIPTELVMFFGDTHIYKNHIDQVKLQLKRSPFRLPELALNPNVTDIDNFRFNDVKIFNYNSHGPIKGDLAV